MKDMELDEIFSAMEHGLTLAGFLILDGDNHSFFVRDKGRDIDYEVKVEIVAE